MARIRTIKPEFWQHPKVMAVSRDARLMFIGLLNEADDEGRLRFQAKRLSGVIFPGDDDVDCADLLRWTSELEGVGLIVRYQVDDGDFVVLPGFTEHQKINRPSDSKLPPPPFTEGSVRDQGVLTDDSLPEQGTGNRESRETTRNLRKSRSYSPGEDFSPTDSHVEYARSHGLSLQDELDGWRDWCTANGRTYAQLNAGFSTWLRRAVSYGRGGLPVGDPVPVREPGLVLPPARVETCPVCESSVLACVCRRN